MNNHLKQLLEEFSKAFLSIFLITHDVFMMTIIHDIHEDFPGTIKKKKRIFIQFYITESKESNQK